MCADSLGDWLSDVRQPLQTGRPAQGHVGRQRKVHCEACGFIAYASRGALQRSGLPSCGCGQAMTLANLRDRAAVESDALLAELESYGPAVFNDAMRELGRSERWTAEHGGKYGHGGAEQKRCQWAGGYCSTYTAGLYCAEHTPAGLDAHYSDRRGA